MYIRSIRRKKIPVLVFTVLAILGLVSCKSTPEPTERNLVSLVKARDLEGIKAYFKTEEIGTHDESGLSLLHIAVLQNDPQIISYLIQMGADIEERDTSGRTPLLAAAAENSFAAAQILAQHNAYLFASDAEEISAFDILREKKKTALVLNAETVLQKDSKKNTALHIAVQNLDPVLVSEILKAAAGNTAVILQEREAKQHTALELAYGYPQKKEAAMIADMLLRAGAEPTRGSFTCFESAAVQHNYGLRFENGQTVLHIEAAQGRTGFVLFLLDNKVDIDAQDISHTTPLHAAVRNSHTATAAVLLKAGASPRAEAALGNTALHAAVSSPARKELIPLLLENRANPSAKDAYGETPLHIAVRIGADTESISALLHAGAEVNERNKKGESPLLLAVERDLQDQAVLLISCGADIHKEDTQKRTPFVEAVRNHKTVLPVLVTEKTGMQQDSKGRNALHLAVLLNTDVDVIRYIIEQKTDVNAPDKAGNTPLHYAVAHNNQEIGTVLINAGADIFATNKQGESPLKTAYTKQGGRASWILTPETVCRTDGSGATPLHYAASWGTTAVIPLIIEQGGDINAKNIKGETPLFAAVKADNSETVNALAAAQGSVRIDYHARDFLGNTVLHTAIGWRALGAAEAVVQENTGTAALLKLQNAAGKTPLHIAAQQGDIPFLNLFLTYRADINTDGRDGRTPLTDALMYGKNNTVLFLLQHGADPLHQDIHGRSPLHEAVGIAPPPIIRALRQAGADPLARDSYGNTPLGRSFTMAVPVLEAVLGTDPSITNSDGETPLHIAVREKADEKTMQYLIKKKYPINKRNRTGSTALTLAAKQRQVSLCTVLIQEGADIFAADAAGQSVLSIALTEDNETLLPLLQRESAAKTDEAGNGFFHYAARYAATETLRRLLAAESEVKDTKNLAGETPADIALRWQGSEVAELFNRKETAP